MSVTTVTSAGTQSVTVSGAQNHKLTNLSLPTPNTEVSHALTSNLKQLIIRSRTKANAKLSFTVGESGTKYMTIPRNSNLSLESLDFSSESLYLQADVATVMEILELY